MTLKEAKVGQTVRVARLEGEAIYVRKVAPLGDPVEITIRGYELSLRKADSEMIQVVPA